MGGGIRSAAADGADSKEVDAGVSNHLEEVASSQVAASEPTQGNFELYGSADSEQFVLLGDCKKDCDAEASDHVLVHCMADLSIQAISEDRQVFTFTRGQGFDLVCALSCYARCM